MKGLGDTYGVAGTNRNWFLFRTLGAYTVYWQQGRLAGFFGILLTAAIEKKTAKLLGVSERHLRS